MLISFDKHYSDLMNNLGVPAFALPLVLGARESVSYQKTGKGSYEVAITSDFMPENTYDMKLGEITLITYGPSFQSGIMHTNCTLPEPNHLVCTAEERDKGWKLIENSYFSQVCK